MAPKGGHMDRRDQGSELVALASATAFVYRQVMGVLLDPADVNEWNHVMHEVARAVSSVVSIYGARTVDDQQKPLPTSALVGCGFERGATVLQTPGGLTYQKLAIQRKDMLFAVEVLKRTGVKFAGR